MSTAGEKWLKKAIVKKGKWFDYSEVNYVKAKVKVKITCKTCGGTFEQTPDSHYRKKGKYGCPYCAGKKYTTEIIQSKIKEVYGDKYDVSKVVFTKTANKVTIGCKIHGDFQAIVNNLLRGVAGCKKCSDSSNGKACRMSVPEFLAKVTTKFNYKYTYPDLAFSSLDDIISIICPIHGTFQTTAREHLTSATGCNNCGKQAIADFHRLTDEEFIARGNKVHNGYYNYKQVQYIDSRTPVTITCPIHGNFEQTPSAHLRGSGCQRCAHYGFKDYLPGILYYVKVEFGPYIAYKIGITNKTINERFSRDLDKITVIKYWDFAQGKNARAQEQTILKNFKVYAWGGPDLLHSGNTELFDRDVLELDIKESNE